MSKQIRSSDLREQLDHYGPLAAVTTVADDLRPHVVTSLVTIDGEHLVLHVGARTAENLAERPALCLTWSAPASEEHLLIVDGTASRVDADGDGFRVVVTPETGIRHRRADAVGDGPTCLRLSEDPPG